MEVWSFEISRFGQGLKLSWVVYNESPNLKYELQRSEDGGHTFHTIGTVKGKGQTRNEYQFLDTDMSGTPGKNLQYRLRYLMPNGKINTFSPREEAILSAEGWERFPKLVPDPSTGRIKFAYELKRPGKVRAILLDIRLDEMASMELPNQKPGKYLKAMDLTALPPGRYLLIIRADGRPLRRYRVVK